MSQKRRPEIMKPGLKMLTPHEKKLVERMTSADRARWEYLFHPDRNRWVLIK